MHLNVIPTAIRYATRCGCAKKVPLLKKPQYNIFKKIIKFLFLTDAACLSFQLQTWTEWNEIHIL